MSVLDRICARKLEHIEAQKSETPLESLKAQISAVEPPLGFIEALQSHEAPAIIAEVKKASPSRGIIRDDFDPVKIAQHYQAAGAACLSVLTDEPYFQGHDDYLRAVRKAVKLPLLRKDFMLDPYQIYEARSLGADCILLIMAALDNSHAAELYDLSQELGMDVLVEVHDDMELERAMSLKPKMIGINNRNLKTLDVDIQTSFKLGDMIPGTVTKIAESGISTPENIKTLSKAGFNGFLVGESLMKEADIENALRHLRGKPLTQNEN